jgi:serine/threonine protein kinase
MESQPNRRKWDREILDPPELGYLLTEGPGYESGTAFIDPPEILYVDLLNKCKDGAALKTAKKIAPATTFSLFCYNHSEKLWQVFRGEAKWTRPVSEQPNNYLVGAKIKKQSETRENIDLAAECREIPDPSDFEFFNQTRLFNSAPREALCPLLNSLSYKEIRAGERFMVQGDPGDSFFIVQRGTCVVCVEKDHKKYTVARLEGGDVVGEMAMLTGETRSAHVEAETDMQLWGLTRKKFDDIAARHPELRNFLTELVADRFSSRKLTADRTIGKYLITDIIGQGGYSIVYKGVHCGLNMPVAIKMMKHDLAMDGEFLSKFQTEAKVIAKLNHENIIKVYDIEELYRTVFIIMELTGGETIKELMKREKIIAFPRIVNFLLQICNGLAYAHQEGIIHRDVKPANMFIASGDHLKLLDFGLSCSVGSENIDFSGTVAFMSPEEIEGESVDQRSDIYALGITTYEMLTGRRPFPEENLLALMDMHLKQDVPDPSDIRPDIPPELRQIVLTAGNRQPDQRYQNVQQMLEILVPLARKFGLSSDDIGSGKKSMTTLHLIYQDEKRLALKKLMEEFSLKAKEIGVELKAAEFPEI